MYICTKDFVIQIRLNWKNTKNIMLRLDDENCITRVTLSLRVLVTKIFESDRETHTFEFSPLISSLQKYYLTCLH